MSEPYIKPRCLSRWWLLSWFKSNLSTLLHVIYLGQGPFLAYFPLKMDEKIMWSPICLSAFLPLTTFEPMVEFYEIQYGGHAM
jgi:hypothetical protein